MINSTTHNHCDFCDGKSSLQEMIEAAINANFTDFGMSCHGKCVFDPVYGVENEQEYINAVREMQRKYANVLNITCGIEQDFYAPVKMREKLDYIIGSVHYLKDAKGNFVPVDSTKQSLCALAGLTFGGDTMAMVEQFYDVTVKNVQMYKPEIIGHFDLITKNNQDNEIFNEHSTRYKNMALDALQKCVEIGGIFEVNTGAMARGYKEMPYPAPFLLQGLKDMNASITINADCHNAKQIDFGFEQTQNLLRKIGFKQITILKNGKFVQEEL